MSPPNDYLFHQPALTPRIAISACLVGQPVRYDGQHKYQPLLDEVIAPHARLYPLCPEAGAGLGIPRPPIQLVQQANHIAVQTVHDGTDVSAPLLHWIQQQLPLLAQCHGAILKIRSPSCGLDSTPVYDANGQSIAYRSGLFAAALQHADTPYVLASEEQLQTRQQAQDFLLRCRLLQESQQASSIDALLTHYQRWFPALHSLAEWQTLIADTGNDLPDILQTQTND